MFIFTELLAMPYSVYLLGQRRKPLTCFVVSTAYFIPASAAILIHYSTLSLVGLKSVAGQESGDISIPS